MVAAVDNNLLVIKIVQPQKAQRKLYVIFFCRPETQVLTLFFFSILLVQLCSKDTQLEYLDFMYTFSRCYKQNVKILVFGRFNLRASIDFLIFFTHITQRNCQTLLCRIWKISNLLCIKSRKNNIKVYLYFSCTVLSSNYLFQSLSCSCNCNCIEVVSSHKETYLKPGKKSKSLCPLCSKGNQMFAPVHLSIYSSI